MTEELKQFIEKEERTEKRMVLIGKITDIAIPIFIVISVILSIYL